MGLASFWLGKGDGLVILKLLYVSSMELFWMMLAMGGEMH
jgi:hypothetical protein